MKQYTTEQLQEMIEKYWFSDNLSFYFAQVLSGEETIQSTIKDLESFQKKK